MRGRVARQAASCSLAAALIAVAALGPPPHARLPGSSGPAATPSPLLFTGEGEALRVGPAGAAHHVGLAANGEGAVGVALAPDGAFLAFTCGMRPAVDAWYSGDWYRGVLGGDRPAEVVGPDGERLRLTRREGGRLAGEVVSPGGEVIPLAADPAAAEDGLFRRDDADGVLGAVALPGNTVCAVKRTEDGRFLPAGTVPY